MPKIQRQSRLLGLSRRHRPHRGAGEEFPHAGTDLVGLGVVDEEGDTVEGVFDGVHTVLGQAVLEDGEDYYLEASEELGVGGHAV